MPLSPGDQLGPYVILAPIGAGGMGEVYKARDTRLDRIIAIKLSKTEFSERFERETRAIAALNHPNICQLYDQGNLPEGRGYLVMEYIDGSPIAGVDSPRKLLDLAVQIADGLAAAHAAGFTHRDLKPDNILVTGPQTHSPGRVKILDFGLAKRTSAIAESDATQTVVAATNPGTVLGTVAYMSPEQARGAEVDARSDQFAFGLILYELAAHKRAFVRDSAAETMTAIIRDEAEPLPPTVPAPLRWVIERCMAKDPAERYDSTRDLYRELKLARERLSEVSASGPQALVAVAAPAVRRPRWRTWAGGTAAAFAGFGVALFWSIPAPEPPRPEPFATELDLQANPRWAPAGDRIAYVAAVDGTFQVFTKKLDSIAPTQITHEPASCSLPFWSADGTRIYFIEGLFPTQSVRSIAVAGGPSQLVRDNVLTAELTPDGKTMALLVRDDTGKYRLAFASPPEAAPQFYTRGKFTTFFASIGTAMHIHPSGRFVGLIFADKEFWKVPLDGGEPELMKGLPTIDDFAFWSDERRVVAIHVTNPSDSDLSVVDISTGASRRFFSAGSQTTPAVSRDGRILAVPLMERGYDVIEVPLDGSPPRDVVATPRDEVAPSWSPDGSGFAYITNRSGGDQLWMRNRNQGLERLIASAKDFPGTSSPVFLDSAISPDGTRVAYRMEDGRDYSVWISSLSGDTPSRLWNDPAQEQRGASWSPDGAWIAFYGVRDGRNTVSKARVGGNATPDLVAYTTEPQPVRWSPDGAWIAYRDGSQLRLVSPDGQQKRVVSERKWETYGWSKDGTALYGIAIDEHRHHILARIDVASARETKIADYGMVGGAVDFGYLLADFPYRGFSLNPDGKSFLTSIYRAKSQIYLLRDFNRPVRLIDRWLGH
ncbi:MAG: serine/threonine protein kinase [Bryobacterales bacterium]|jgi:Tol biopolymer transport system component/tRNA A-37 threonylcarbamoyl transferase component Bud32|nr:serine/threonine protein kinase [Bryobacterales bacterium]